MGETFDAIEQKVRAIIASTLKVKEEEVSKGSTIEELGGDSLAALAILSGLEREFDIDISDGDAMEIVSFGKAVEVVKANV